MGRPSALEDIGAGAPMSSALSGFRVLDLSDSIAGQFCCRMMADFGAEVTLVEPPSGSPTRGMPPFDPAKEWRRRAKRRLLRTATGSLLFFHLNLGKGSIALDRTTDEGRAKLLELVKSADAVVVGVDADRDALQKANPGCIVALVSDFGDDGPYRHWRGSEMIFQALSGMMHVNGTGDREPLYGVGHRAQYAAGVGAYIAVLAALYARKTIGQGQQVALDVAMNTSSMAPPATVEYAYSRMQDPRGERRSPFMVVKCSDGLVSIWVHLHVWAGFCKAANIAELEHDPRFAKGKERQDNWAELTRPGAGTACRRSVGRRIARSSAEGARCGGEGLHADAALERHAASDRAQLLAKRRDGRRDRGRSSDRRSA